MVGGESADNKADSPENSLDNRPGLAKTTSTSQSSFTTTPKVSPVKQYNNIYVTEHGGDQGEKIGGGRLADLDVGVCDGVVVKDDDGQEGGMKAHTVPNVNTDIAVKEEECLYVEQDVQTAKYDVGDPEPDGVLCGGGVEMYSRAEDVVGSEHDDGQVYCGATLSTSKDAPDTNSET